MPRLDKRTPGDLRSLGLSTSVSSRSDGSAQFSHGPVTVLATVSGPIEVRIRDEIVDRAHLEVNVRPVRGAPGSWPSTKSLADTLSYILLPILLLNRHPRSLIQLSVQTLTSPSTKFSKPFRTYSEDSMHDSFTDIERESVVEKAAAINASLCALMDAAIGMKGTLCAAAIAIVAADEDASDDGMAEAAPTIVLDPSPEEERDAQCTLCMAFSFGQGNGGNEGDVCFLEMGGGSCSEEQLMQATTLARGAAQTTLAFIRKSQEARYT